MGLSVDLCNHIYTPDRPCHHAILQSFKNIKGTGLNSGFTQIKE